MESKTLSEQIEWEARRVAAVFGVQEWGKVTEEVELGVAAFTGLVGEQRVTWAIMEHTGQYAALGVRDFDSYISYVSSYVSVVQNGEGVWLIAFEGAQHNELMARGLFRLGFKEESVLSQLPALPAHEKAELRLSLPREFWPKQWLDEEEAGK